MKTNKAMLRAVNRIQHSRGIAVDLSGMFLYSALNWADQGGTASIGASGMLTIVQRSGRHGQNADRSAAFEFQINGNGPSVVALLDAHRCVWALAV